MDIDSNRSEKKTLLGFLGLYSFLMLIILTFVGFLYFQFQKELMLGNKRIQLQDYSNELIARLKDLHINFDKYKYYPRDERFNSAIYDSDKQLIFSTLKAAQVRLDEVTYTTENFVHFIEEPDAFYLGAKYVILEIKDTQSWAKRAQHTIAVYGVLGFVFLLFMGFFLLRLFLKPMRDSYALLDRFIKDTTHELNTPIAAIVANIELIDVDALEDEKLQRKIKRIDIGAKTVSNIYQDMTYLTLNNKIISRNESLNMKELIIQRAEYFRSLADVKKITLNMELHRDTVLWADNQKVSKLLDNILSNAIKYNKINGSITVRLENNSIVITDTGQGIEKEKIVQMFERYRRFESHVGGFGIGLNIAAMICKEYNINIQIDSEIKKGTTVRLSW